MTAAKLAFWVIAGRPTLLAALVVLALGVAAGEVTIPWLIQRGIDAALGESDVDQVHHVGMMMVGVIAALYVLHCLLLRVEARVVYQGSFRLRQRLYTHVLLQPLSFFTKSRSGELVHRVVNDTSVFEDNAVYLFSDLPFEIFTVIGVLALMAVTDLTLAVVVVIFLAVATVVSARVGRPLPTLRKSIQGVSAALSGRLQEALTGIRTVKSFAGERKEIERLDAENHRVMQLETREGNLEGFLVPVFDLMELLGVVIVVWYGAYLIIEGRLTPGGLVAFMAYMEILAGPVSRAGKFYRHLQQVRGVAGRLAAFVSEGAPELPSSRPIAEPLPSRPWAIAFDRVTFTYPDASQPAIDELTLRVDPSDVVAIVGKNGAGKSTLMDLLLGLHRPTSGSVVVGDRDLGTWDIEAWRHAVGTMPQDVFLFHASIAENIAYARPDATTAEIEAGAMNAGLGPLIARLPDGLRTIVGDRGSRLSGGERQRIAMARLFLKRPDVLVLDEPTSHLDGEAIAAIGDAVRWLAVGRTTFIVAHRPETIRLAKRVIVLDGGRIVGDGRHEDLLVRLPLYRTLLAEHDPSEKRASRAKAPKNPARV